MSNPSGPSVAKAAPAASSAPDPLRELGRAVNAVRGEIALYWFGFALEVLFAGVLTYLVAWGTADVWWDLAPGTHRVLRAVFFMCQLDAFLFDERQQLLDRNKRLIPKRFNVRFAPPSEGYLDFGDRVLLKELANARQFLFQLILCQSSGYDFHTVFFC